MPIRDVELKVLDEFNEEIQTLLDSMGQPGNAKQDAKTQKEIDKKLPAYKSEIDAAKAVDPFHAEVLFHESDYHVMRAVRTLSSSVFMRRFAQKDGFLLTRLAAHGIAGVQEKANAAKATEILDEALAVYDNAWARLIKAQILLAMNQKEQAMAELRHIVQNLSAQERSYIAAKKQLAELENPPKKGPCFVATACYGSYDHPDVLVLRNWRDQVLMLRRGGRGFVRFYYAFGPALAGWVSGRPRVAAWIRRGVLEPLVEKLRGRQAEDNKR